MQAESGSAHSTDKPDWLKIGFNEIGRRTVLDIEVAIIKLNFFDCT
jgi:tRNA (uracil-5-)-methyltransferase